MMKNNHALSFFPPFLFLGGMIIILVAIFMSPLYFTESFSQEQNQLMITPKTQEEEENPITYKVGIELLNIGAINRQHGTYDLTFWIIITNDDDDGSINDINFVESPPPIQWDFPNGNIQEITGVSTQPNFHAFKVHGTFHNNVDFTDYPFENMNLVIYMEPLHPNTTEKMAFKINEKYDGIINIATASIPGWNLMTPEFEISAYSYVWGDFTRFTATYPVGVDLLGPFLKKILPIIILMVFGFATFGLSARNLSDRIAIISAVLISAVMFHAMFLLSELPPIGYLTLADKIMTAAYAFFMFILFVALRHRHLSKTKGDKYTVEDAEKEDKKMTLLAPFVIMTVFAAVYFI